MTRHLRLVFLALAALAVARPAAADGWIFRPSTYSHDEAGNRVAQYQPERPAFFRFDDTYMESGYRHSHISIPGGDGSYDHLHVVQTWGLGEFIRPYGEWEYPYRAGATPYGPWGNPSGPWTLPFDSWQNPYGLGKLPWGGYSPYYPPRWPDALRWRFHAHAARRRSLARAPRRLNAARIWQRSSRLRQRSIDAPGCAEFSWRAPGVSPGMAATRSPCQSPG